jgi:8-amino-7-oxononanoate synthase
MVDDAHGVGVIGPKGRGAVAAAGLGAHEVPLLMLTLGKAIGTFGAVVLGSAAMVDALIQFARPYIYTTAMPPALAAATLAAVRIARDEEWRREKLNVLIEQFRTGAEQKGFTLLPSTTAIQPLLIGSSDQAVRLSADLERCGFYVPAIRPPTVPEPSARLRVTLSALHEERDIGTLLAAMEQCIKPHLQSQCAPQPNASRTTSG